MWKFSGFLMGRELQIAKHESNYHTNSLETALFEGLQRHNGLDIIANYKQGIRSIYNLKVVHNVLARLRLPTHLTVRRLHIIWRFALIKSQKSSPTL